MKGMKELRKEGKRRVDAGSVRGGVDANISLSLSFSLSYTHQGLFCFAYHGEKAAIKKELVVSEPAENG